MNTLGDRIKLLREEKKITQKQLAEVLGVSQQSIARYEKNAREPEFNILKKLVDYFEISTDYLLGISSNRYSGEEWYKNFKYRDVNFKEIFNSIDKNCPDELKEQVYYFIDYIRDTILIRKVKDLDNLYLIIRFIDFISLMTSNKKKAYIYSKVELEKLLVSLIDDNYFKTGCYFKEKIKNYFNDTESEIF